MVSGASGLRRMHDGAVLCCSVCSIPQSVLGVAQAVECLTIEHLIPQPPIEAFVPSISKGDPVSHSLCDELRADVRT